MLRVWLLGCIVGTSAQQFDQQRSQTTPSITSEDGLNLAVSVPTGGSFAVACPAPSTNTCDGDLVEWNDETSSCEPKGGAVCTGSQVEVSASGECRAATTPCAGADVTAFGNICKAVCPVCQSCGVFDNVDIKVYATRTVNCNAKNTYAPGHVNSSQPVCATKDLTQELQAFVYGKLFAREEGLYTCIFTRDYDDFVKRTPALAYARDESPDSFHLNCPMPLYAGGEVDRAAFSATVKLEVSGRTLPFFGGALPQVLFHQQGPVISATPALEVTSQNLNESPTQTITFTVTDEDSSDQLTSTVTVDNTAIFPEGSLSLTGGGEGVFSLAMTPSVTGDETNTINAVITVKFVDTFGLGVERGIAFTYTPVPAWAGDGRDGDIVLDGSQGDGVFKINDLTNDYHGGWAGRVPEFKSVTLVNGATLTAVDRNNGNNDEDGGLIMFFAHSLRICSSCKISATGLRGPYPRHNSASCGDQGHGQGGGNRGCGGYGCCHGTGGGGGSFKTSGSSGVGDSSRNSGERAGAGGTYWVDNWGSELDGSARQLSDRNHNIWQKPVYNGNKMWGSTGGAGGGGHGHSEQCRAGWGGKGGGAIKITVWEMVLDGTIEAKGEQGLPHENDQRWSRGNLCRTADWTDNPQVGSGGGGSGGYVSLLTGNVVDSGKIDVSGGERPWKQGWPSANNDGQRGGHGGNGGIVHRVQGS